MQEVILKNNTTGLKIYINGVPNLKLVPKDETDNAVAALETQIAKYFEGKRKKAGKKPP